MEITIEKLAELSACRGGVDWFKAQKETALDKVCFALVESNHANWADWLLTKLMDREQRIQYAIFAAEQVLDIFEKKHPDDKRPRLAIEAAKKALAADTPESKNAVAADAAYAAYAAAAAYAYAAYAAYAADAYAAYAAADAAYAAYAAAAAAAYAAYAADAYAADAAAAAYAAAYAADAAYAAARKEMQLKIVKFGIEILTTPQGI